MAQEHIVPNFEWYAGLSAQQGLPPRCPYASVERCPRYYQSLWALGMAGSTAIEQAEEERLLKMWKRSDLWPKTREYETSVSGSNDKYDTFDKFCPEVAFDRFSQFATFLAGYADELDAELTREQLARDGVSRDDWRWFWAAVEPMHYSACPLYSPLSLGPTPVPGVGESPAEVTFGLPGLKITFRPSWRKAQDWWARLWLRLRAFVQK